MYGSGYSIRSAALAVPSKVDRSRESHFSGRLNVNNTARHLLLCGIAAVCLSAALKCYVVTK